VVTIALVAALAWRALGLFPGGRGATSEQQDVAAAGTRPGMTLTEVAMNDDGTLHTLQTFAFARPQSHLDLSLPERRGPAADFTPRITSLVTHGADVRGAPGAIATGARAILRFAQPVARVVLDYRVSHAAVRSRPSAPERALVLVTPLVVRQARAEPSRVEVNSVKVLNVGCVRGSGALVGCGTHTSAGWVVESAGTVASDEGPGAPGGVDVVAQVNLATP
jgi:hypothetical protein